MARLTERINENCIELLCSDGKKKSYWDRLSRLTFPAVEKLAAYEDLCEDIEKLKAIFGLYEQDFQTDGFTECFDKIYCDTCDKCEKICNRSGDHERRLIDMLRDAFVKAEVIDGSPKNVTTVGELIKALQQYDLGLPVGVGYDPSEKVRVCKRVWVHGNYPYNKPDVNYVSLE